MMPLHQMRLNRHQMRLNRQLRVDSKEKTSDFVPKETTRT